MIIKGPNIITKGLFFLVDAMNPRSYNGSGSVWKDISRNGNHLTLVNSPTFNSSGYFDFNGSSQYGQVTTKTSYTPYCIDIWFYNDDTIGTSIMPGPYQMLSGLGPWPSGISFGAFLGSATNETIMIIGEPSGGNWESTYIKDIVTPGLHNLIINWNGSSYDFWIDGEKKTTYYGSVGACPLNIQDSITIANTFTYTAEFDGRIYRCAKYNRQLSDTEVLHNYNLLSERYI